MLMNAPQPDPPEVATTNDDAKVTDEILTRVTAIEQGQAALISRVERILSHFETPPQEEAARQAQEAESARQVEAAIARGDYDAISG